MAKLNGWFGRVSEATVAARQMVWGMGLQAECKELGRDVTVEAVVGTKVVAITLDNTGRYVGYDELRFA